MLFFLIFLVFPLIQATPTCNVEKLLECAKNLHAPVIDKKNSQLQGGDQFCDQIEKCSDVFLACGKLVRENKSYEKISAFLDRAPTNCALVRLLSNEDFKPCADKMIKGLKLCPAKKAPQNCEEWTPFGECAVKTITGVCNEKSVEALKKTFENHKTKHCK